MLYEAVLFPSITKHLNKLDSVSKKGGYHRGMIYYTSTDTLIDTLNDIFFKDFITFVVSTKRNATTDNKGNITINVSSNFYDIFVNDYNTIRDNISYILTHELVHREQVKRIDWSKYNKKDIVTHKDYMGNKQEIMAFARNTIIELRSMFKWQENKIFDFLRTPVSDISDTFDIYINHFKNDKKVMNRLFKYMYQYLIEDK